MAGTFLEAGELIGVNLYAVKGCAPTTYQGEPIEAFQVGPTGPELDDVVDRGIVIASVVDADARRAHFASLRGWDEKERGQYPGDSRLVHVHSDIIGPSRVRVSIPGEEPLELDLANPVDTSPWEVAIHSGRYPAVDLGDNAAAAISRYLLDSGKVGRDGTPAPVRELRMFGPHPDFQRRVRDEYLRSCASNVIAGADGTALLLENVETIKQTGADPRRARANLTTVMDPGIEDYITALEIGEDGFSAVAIGGCKRCVATGVNPETGKRDNIFLQQIAQRAGETAVHGQGIYYGLGLSPTAHGRCRLVRAGDKVRARVSNAPNVALRSAEKVPAT